MRLPPLVIREIDQLAAARGLARSQITRELIIIALLGGASRNMPAASSVLAADPPTGGGPSGRGRRMKGFVADIEALTEDNEDFRRVLYTGRNLQLVLMSLNPGEEIGEEVHEGHDQFFRIEQGSGEVLIDGARTAVKDDDAVIVPAGARHNVVNTGDEPLRLYTIYAPPEHRDGLVQSRKPGPGEEEHFDGRTTE